MSEQCERRGRWLVAVGERRRRGRVWPVAALAAEHQRDVGVADCRQPEQALEQDLARGRLGKIGAAHDLTDPLGGVVDDHCQLVGMDAVSTNDDEIIDNAALRARAAGPRIDSSALGAQPQREALTGLDARRTPAAAGELAAGARDRRPPAARRGAPGGLADLRAGAEARVQDAQLVQLAQRVVVEREPLSTVAPAPDPNRSRVRAGRRVATARTQAASAAGRGPRSAAESGRPGTRAINQATSAVRRLPRCSGPVGDGAKRPSAFTSA